MGKLGPHDKGVKKPSGLPGPERVRDAELRSRFPCEINTALASSIGNYRYACVTILQGKEMGQYEEIALLT